jgi:hypothetical protein
MRNIRRAAVTGLFAIWLAPLSATAATSGGPSFRADRPVQAERAAEMRRDREEDQETQRGEAGPDA